MRRLIWNFLCILSLMKSMLSRLVITESELDDIDSHIIEQKASIVDDFLRESDCKGVKVFLSHYYK